MNSEILKKVINGDTSAFSVLYNHYKKPAVRFCYSLVKDEDEAENMIQEVFIKIWERREQINPDLNFNSYLFTCLRNVSFDYLKKIEREQALRTRYWERIEELHTDDGQLHEDRLIQLENAIDTLSLKRKQILKMSMEDSMSYHDIASTLKISKNTVKNQLVKARQFLKFKLDLVAM